MKNFKEELEKAIELISRRVKASKNREQKLKALGALANTRKLRKIHEAYITEQIEDIVRRYGEDILNHFSNDAMLSLISEREYDILGEEFADEEIEKEARDRDLITDIEDYETEELIAELKNRGVEINKPIKDMETEEIREGFCDRYGVNHFTHTEEVAALFIRDEYNKI